MSIIVAIALVVSGFLDMRSTDAAIARGAVEKNPVWVWVMAKFGKNWGKAKMAVHLAAAGYVFMVPDPINLIAGAVLSAITVGVAYSNTKKGRK